jgi:hypothetical protein
MLASLARRFLLLLRASEVEASPCTPCYRWQARTRSRQASRPKVEDAMYAVAACGFRCVAAADWESRLHRSMHGRMSRAMRDVVLSRRHRLSARPRKTRRASRTLKSLLKAGTCRLVKQWSRASGVRKVRGWAAANHREPAGTTERGPPALWFTLFGGRWYVEGLPRDCAKETSGSHPRRRAVPLRIPTVDCPRSPELSGDINSDSSP